MAADRRRSKGEADKFTDETVRARLPHNIEAERAVLGGIMVDNRQFDVAAGVISEREFFRDAHRRIWLMMLTLSEAGSAIDMLTLTNGLKERDELEDVGGTVYLSGLVDGVPRSSNVEHYARIVKDAKAKRGLVYYAQKLIEQVVKGDEPAGTLLEQADAALLDLQAGHVHGQMVSLTDGADGIYKRLEWRQENRGVVTGVPTGFTLFDEMTRGLQPGHLWIVAARPSYGKTTLAMNIAVNAARLAGKRGAVFSLEMMREELEDRMLASLSGVDHQRIMTGFLSEADQARVGQGLAMIHTLPISIDDTSGRGAPSIRRIARRMKGEGGLDFVIVDYLQLMPGTLDKRTTRDEQIDDICLRLKGLAKELRIPVILLSQLNRDSGKRADDTPQLSDLRGSGSIEQHADGVLFLHRDDHRKGGVTKAIIGKQRNGPTGTLGLSLERETLTFTEAAIPEPEPKAPKATRERRLKPAPPTTDED